MKYSEYVIVGTELHSTFVHRKWHPLPNSSGQVHR
jgi:hypothetical protein